MLQVSEIQENRSTNKDEGWGVLPNKEQQLPAQTYSLVRKTSFYSQKIIVLMSNPATDYER